MQSAYPAVPIMVGITGHRDLVVSEMTQIRARLEQFYSDLQQRFPDLPIVTLSAMATGADQLAAEVALDLGLEVCAILPMPLEDYRQDFDDDSLQKLDELLKRCSVASLPNLGETADRSDHYVAVGGYIAAHCHVLVAIWDGKESESPGGTNRVMRFHQHDTMNFLSKEELLSAIDFTEDESDLVFHIACSRNSTGGPEGEMSPGDGCWITRNDIAPTFATMPYKYAHILDQQAKFNSEITPELYRERLLADEEAVEKADVSGIQTLFNKADQLAQKFQRLSMFTIRTSHILMFVAGLSFIIYTDLYSRDFVIYCYLTCVVLISLLFFVENRWGWHERYLEYRVLAEALRVQFYWSVAGVEMSEAHHFTHDSLHGQRDLELGWIRNVLRYTARTSDARIHFADDSWLPLVIREWVGNETSGQRGYYGNKSAQGRRNLSLTRVLELFSLTMVIAVVILLVINLEAIDNRSDLLIALAGILPLFVAIRKNYAYRNSEREMVSQYQYYLRLFTNASKLLDRASDNQSKRSILRALGEAALDENSQWLLSQKERSVMLGG